MATFHFDLVSPEKLLFSGDVGLLAAAEPEILKHMNEDHGDAIARYAHQLPGRTGSGWRMSGIDPEGTDLRCDGEPARPADAPAQPQ